MTRESLSQRGQVPLRLGLSSSLYLHADIVTNCPEEPCVDPPPAWLRQPLASPRLGLPGLSASQARPDRQRSPEDPARSHDSRPAALRLTLLPAAGVLPEGSPSRHLGHVPRVRGTQGEASRPVPLPNAGVPMRESRVDSNGIGCEWSPDAGVSRRARNSRAGRPWVWLPGWTLATSTRCRGHPSHRGGGRELSSGQGGAPRPPAKEGRPLEGAVWARGPLAEALAKTSSSLSGDDGSVGRW